MKVIIFLLKLVLLALVLFPVGVNANNYHYRVTKVAANDVLNIRAEPNSSSAIVARIPFNGVGISLSGASRRTGRSTWVKIRWQNNRGWVNRAYLAPMLAPATVKPSPMPSRPAAINPVTDNIVKKRVSGMWILECRGTSPKWSLDILPEWIRGTVGDFKTGMPITRTHQEHGLYNRIALRTEVEGANRWNKVDLTLVYTARCYNSLFNQRVTFEVKGQYNNTPLKGCCRAMRVP